MSRSAADPRRVLFVSGFRIFPTQTGAHLRTGGIARVLARLGYQVLIYSLGGRRSDYHLPWRTPGRIVVEMEKNLTEEINLGLGFGLLQAVARRLDYPRVWQYELLRRGFIPAGLRRALNEADLIICDSSYCPVIPGPWSRKPWFMLSHNLENRLLEHTAPRHRQFAPWMKRVEAAAPGTFQDIFPCADDDLQFFRSHDPSARLRLPLIRCGVDPSVYAVPAETRTRVRAELGLTDADRLLIFSGSRFEPNLDALRVLREFCHAEAEFLARERVHILVLGSVCDAASREGALITTGRVPESIPYFAASDAGLNPMSLGSGANVKLFEYLAARLPILSTAFGVRGTELQPNIDYVAFEIPDLKSAIQTFISHSREEWQAHAEAVWTRHRSDCDIQILVANAIAQLPEFDLRGITSASAPASSASGSAAGGYESASAPAIRTAGRSSTPETG